jgi:hypothetical protein
MQLHAFLEENDAVDQSESENEERRPIQQR